jgi:hypothetical protein
MKIYKFIKITDNDDHRKFCIDVTSMSDYRIRVSILWSKYLKYLDNKGQYRCVFEVLATDWSAYCVGRYWFENPHEAKAKQVELVNFYQSKLKDYKPKEVSCVVSFT